MVVGEGGGEEWKRERRWGGDGEEVGWCGVVWCGVVWGGVGWGGVGWGGVVGGGGGGGGGGEGGVGWGGVGWGAWVREGRGGEGVRRGGKKGTVRRGRERERGHCAETGRHYFLYALAASW